MVRTFELVDHPFQKCESTIHKVGSAIKSKMTPSVKYGSTFIAYIYISLSLFLKYGATSARLWITPYKFVRIMDRQFQCCESTFHFYRPTV